MRIGSAGQLIYATYLDSYHAPPIPTDVSIVGLAIAVDAEGNAYIAGTNTDPDFPTTPGAFQTQCCARGNSTAFLARLNPTGTAPVYSTFLPGESPASVAVDAAGNANLVIDAYTISSYGQATSYTLTTAALSADGSELSGVIDTPLGLDTGLLIPVPDGQGNILVTGQPAPDSLVLSDGAFNNGASYVEILRAADGAVLYASLQPSGAGGGGIGPDSAGGFIALGTGAPAAFVAGTTQAGRPLFMLTRFVPATASQPMMLGLANAFGYAVSEGLAPGEIVGVYGTNLGPAQGVLPGFTGGELPTSLGGTQVLFNRIAAPLLWAGGRRSPCRCAE
jgi:hypothetical protein